MNCVIVEDQRMFAELLVVLLRAVPGVRLNVLASVHTVAAGKTACDELLPDLLLLDIALGDGSGLDVAKHFLAVKPSGRIIILSGHASTFVCPPPLIGAVAAVIDKSDAFQRLQTVLCSLAPVDDRPVPSEEDSAARQSTLSPREREVLLLVGQGRSSVEIADRLGISTHTVHVHRKKLAAKLGTRGSELRLQAYRYWQQVERSTSAGQGR